jgi:release factor glutamine methyltransferase
MHLITLPGVFTPRSDSLMLADAVEEHGPAGARVLDLCTGSGVIALRAAAAGAAEVTAVDVSRRAVLSVAMSARRAGLPVRAVRGDLYAAAGGRRFDLITANPPYLPAARDALPRHGARRAWEGGRDGRAVLDRVIDGAPRHLLPGGTLLVTHSSLCGVGATLRRMAGAGLRAEVLRRADGPLGPLATARAGLLEERGLLAPGERREEVVVIAGVLPPEDGRGVSP